MTGAGARRSPTTPGTSDRSPLNKILAIEAVNLPLPGAVGGPGHGQGRAAV